MKLALKWFLPITLIAMGLAWVSEQVALLLGFDPPPQDLVKLFTDPNIAWAIKAKYAAFAVIAAPIVEEFVFRMGLFNLCRWIGRKLHGAKQIPQSPNLSILQSSNPQILQSSTFPLVSALVSGAVFAAVHVHAATFAPLWFLGVAFAWLYWKSGTIRSSMLCHFLFNLINLSLCLLVGLND